MSLIDTIKEMGSIAVITIVFGVFLSLLIKNLPNHFGNQNYGMFFNLLIVLAGLQLFTIIYIGAKPYNNLYRDPQSNTPVQDNKNFFYYWWDWMYPGYGTKGIELDVFMYIAYLMIIILIILIVLNKVNNKGDFDSQDFKNPIALGICFLEDNGYNIFLFGNIFMFMYISRFIIKGLNLLGSKEISCAAGNIKTCFSEEEVNTYSNIIECNNKMEPAKCPPVGREPITLPGCPTVDDEYLKSVFDYKLPLIIKKEGTSFKLKQDDDNPSYSELPTECKSSIDTFLNGFKSDNFPPMKCGTEGSEYMSVADCDKKSTDNPSPLSGHVFNDGKLCEGGNCTYQDCCGEPPAQQCKDSQWNNSASCEAATTPHGMAPNYVGETTTCFGPECRSDECCHPNQKCNDQEVIDRYLVDQCKSKNDRWSYNREGECKSQKCSPTECCKDNTPNLGCYVNPIWLDDILDGGDKTEAQNGEARTTCSQLMTEDDCVVYGWSRAGMSTCNWGSLTAGQSPTGTTEPTDTTEPTGPPADQSGR